MVHKSVVRNESYQTGSFNVRERHNERKNESYFNGDIELDRAHLNVHYRRLFNEDGAPETYQQTFDRLLAEKVIVKHGTKPDAKLFCEMVFDVNTMYFDENGGYEYAKKFFEEAYHLAVKEAGGEQYVISAIMHADERNKALSEQLGRDVYHYHLHVVYVPVVEKKLYFKKNNKDPEKAGKLKEIIPQISQNRKWPPRMQVERDGAVITVNSYSLLQDRYHEHMKAAGFDGFERGERGSTAEHLDVLDFKIKQDRLRAETMAAVADKKESEIAVLDDRADKKKKRLERIDEQIAVKEKAKATVAEIDAIGKPAMLGGFNVTADELKKMKTLAKKSVTHDDKVVELRGKLKATETELADTKTKLAEEVKKRPSITEHLAWWGKFLAPMKRAPQRLKEVIEDIMRSPPERPEPERAHPERNKTKSRLEAR